MLSCPWPLPTLRQNWNHFGTVFRDPGFNTWRNKLNGAAQGGEYDLLLWWGSVVYITSGKWTVRLGSLLGIYSMRVSRLKSKSGSSSHPGGSVQSPRSQLRKTGKVTQTLMFASPYCLQLSYYLYEI